MTTMAYQITSLTVVYSTVYSGADQRKHQSSASLAFVWGIHREFTGEFPAQMASNTENVSIWWSHHVNIQSGNGIGITGAKLSSEPMFDYWLGTVLGRCE